MDVLTLINKNAYKTVFKMIFYFFNMKPHEMFEYVGVLGEMSTSKN